MLASPWLLACAEGGDPSVPVAVGRRGSAWRLPGDRRCQPALPQPQLLEALPHFLSPGFRISNSQTRGTRFRLFVLNAGMCEKDIAMTSAFGTLVSQAKSFCGVASHCCCFVVKEGERGLQLFGSSPSSGCADSQWAWLISLSSFWFWYSAAPRSRRQPPSPGEKVVCVTVSTDLACQVRALA